MKRLSGLEPELDVATAKKVIKGFAKKIPDLKHFTEFGLKKMKDMEDTGNMIFQKYQQNTMDTKHKQKKFTQAIEKNKWAILNKLQKFKFPQNNTNEDERVSKYRELLKQEKQAFIEQSKIVSQAEVENKILKSHYREALTNVKNELAKILTSDKSFQKFASKINQSDSVHVNPGFGGSSGRMDVKSQSSLTHPNNELDVEGIHHIETSGIVGNNISGTTGGDDDPIMKFNNLLRKSKENSQISGQSLKRIAKLHELVTMYQKTPFKAIFDSKKYSKFAENKGGNFNQTISQDSINQGFTSFFGQSDMKDNKDELSCFNSDNLKQDKLSKLGSSKEIVKDSSFSLFKDFKFGPHKEFEVLKEIKEEIKEESLKRKQNNDNHFTLNFEEETPDKSESMRSENCNFSEISEIKEIQDNQ